PHAAAPYRQSLHDALPILAKSGIYAMPPIRFLIPGIPNVDSGCSFLHNGQALCNLLVDSPMRRQGWMERNAFWSTDRTEKPQISSEEHTSELQSRENLVCR